MTTHGTGGLLAARVSPDRPAVGPGLAAALIALPLAVLVVYGRVGGHPFVNFDDGDYVFSNPHVLRGLTWGGVTWAFTAFHAGNWHPLTWLSHMADVSLFGLSAGRHHLVNVLLHALNTELLFLVLRRMTGSLGRSALVAALFGLHPLHVESVAWVAERKDLLCALFFFLTLGAYLRYVRRPGAGRYLLVVLLFALGLMAKPMIVTLPFVLLLLDYWPLQRPGAAAGRGLPAPGGLFLEKIPLLALSAASCAVTMASQQQGGAIVAVGKVSLGARLANAAVSYIAYLAKTIWPSPLAVLYPHPALSRLGLPLWQAAAALTALVAATGVLLRVARRRPAAAVGWLWFLGMLLPVIGLVQVGRAAMADRYTYLPLTGIFIAVAWGSPAFPGARLRRLTIALGAAALALLSVVTWNRVGVWKDSLTLLSQAAGATRNNWVAFGNLGLTYMSLGQPERAVALFEESLRIMPEDVETRNNLGRAFDQLGLLAKAAESYREAIRILPVYWDPWNNLGVVRAKGGELPAALEHFREAVRLKPDYPEAWRNIGLAYRALGQPREAVESFRKALRIRPDYTEARDDLRETLAALGQPPPSGSPSAPGARDAAALP